MRDAQAEELIEHLQNISEKLHAIQKQKIITQKV